MTRQRRWARWLDKLDEEINRKPAGNFWLLIYCVTISLFDKLKSLQCNFFFKIISCSLDENNQTRCPVFVFRSFVCWCCTLPKFNCILSGKSQFAVIGLWLRQFYELLRRFFQCQSCSDPSKALLCHSSLFGENGEWKRKEDGDNWPTKDQRSWLARKKRYFQETMFVAVLIQGLTLLQMPFLVSLSPMWSWASWSGGPVSASWRSENGSAASPLNVPLAGWTKKSWSAELQKAFMASLAEAIILDDKSSHN